MENKIRIDLFLVKNGFVNSRNKAKQLISKGLIKVNNQLCDEPDFKVYANDQIEILNHTQYVSRGAYKLKAGLEIANFDLKNAVAVDIGCSTGGFSQVLLENQVKKIYAIDVGLNQLDPLIANNPQVVYLQKTNFKDIQNTSIQDHIDFICIDVSFTSVIPIIKKIIELKWDKWKGIILFKPQFEIGIKIKKMKGKVNQKEIDILLKNFIVFLKEQNIELIQYIESPLKGAKRQNKEYLFIIKKD
ncbi:MAG: TlyA family RNA methyltransferase [Malacoplasma sp.]|nr:TlyA family RNA methyltransferase [Malacoplasma sp.]